MLAKGGSAVLTAAALLAGASVAEGHRPPPGYALEHRAERAGHAVEVMVVPKEPRAGEPAEVIVAIWEGGRSVPYRGYVTFLVAPPGGEAAPLGVPLEFEPGHFEAAHVFRPPGVHNLSVVFDVGGSEQRVGPIPVTVRPPSRVAAAVILGLAALTAVTYGAAFRRVRGRAAPGVRHG